jgi:hypothetical protein
MHHALQANVFVQPDSPVGLIVVVDFELIVQQVIAHGVLLRIAGVHRTKLAYPHRHLMLDHKLTVGEILFDNRFLVPVLAIRIARVRSTFDEAGCSVQVIGVDCVGQRPRKHVEILGVAVAFQEQDMIGVDGADRLVQPPVNAVDLVFLTSYGSLIGL